MFICQTRVKKKGGVYLPLAGRGVGLRTLTVWSVSVQGASGRTGVSAWITGSLLFRATDRFKRGAIRSGRGSLLLRATDRFKGGTIRSGRGSLRSEGLQSGKGHNQARSQCRSKGLFKPAKGTIRSGRGSLRSEGLQSGKGAQSDGHPHQLNRGNLAIIVFTCSFTLAIACSLSIFEITSSIRSTI